MYKRLFRLSRVLAVTAALSSLGLGCGGGGGGREKVPPQLLQAVATSRTTVLLTFSEEMAPDTADPVHYAISPDVVVTGAQMSEFNTQVLLTTLPIGAGVSYTVTATEVTDEAGNLIDPEADSAMFVLPPTDADAPQMVRAVATSETTILVTFSERMSADAGDPVHYSLDPDVTIAAAELSEFGTQVLLTTLPLDAGITYTLTADSVTDAAGNSIDPNADSATFVFASADDQAPRLEAGVITSPTTILLTFSEPLADSAGDAARYAIDPGGTILEAALSQFKTQVLLTTLPLVAGVQYTVTADVDDAAGNLIDPAADSVTLSFGLPAADTSQPRVLGAVATSSTTILLFFNEPVQRTAEDVENYTLSPSLTVAQALLNETNTQVQLTTAPMSPNVSYSISIANVVDLSGNEISTVAVAPTVIFDPTTPDTTQPRVLGAVAISATNVLVTFSEPMDDGAGDAARYQLTPGVTITAAQLSQFGTQVNLTVLPLAPGTSYTVMVNGVSDNGGNVILSSSITAIFSFGSAVIDVEPPRIIRAVATSSTTILVSFSEPMDDGAGDPVRYDLAPGGTVIAAQLSQFKTQVLLTTLPLAPGTTYVVTTVGITDKSGNPIDPTANSAQVPLGSALSDTTAPRIIAAVALNATTVVLSFNEPMDDTTGDPVRYSLAPGGTVIQAVLSQFRTQVTLTIVPLVPGVPYTVTADVQDPAGNAIDARAGSIVVSFGMAAADTGPPLVLSAVATSSTTILVFFNEPVRPSALNTANYTLSPNLTVLQTQLNETNTQVLLTTAPMAPGVSYSISIANVADLSGNEISAVAVAPTVVFDPGVPDTTAPRVLGAVAISQTTLLVTFSEPMAPGAADPVRYILAPDGVITAARLSEFGTQVILTVLPLTPGIAYSITVNAISDAADNSIDVSANVAVAFFGPAVSDTTPPRIIAAVVTSETTILVSFSEPMHDTTGDPVRYALAPDGVITAAQLSQFGTQVLLTTLPLVPGRVYTLGASTVIDAAGNLLAASASSTNVVLGLVDNRPPQLINAVIVTPTTIQLTFSEPLGPGAANPALYALTPPVNILNAQLNDAGTQVILSTMPLQQDVTYTVIVNGVADAAGNALPPMMTGVPVGTSGMPEGTADEPLPRLVSGASSSNTSVLVQFSRTMGPSAENAAAYVLTHENVNSEAGRLIVTEAKFVSQSGNATVRLTTRSQNEVIYRLRVAGVSDTRGNPLAQTQVAGGVVIDSSTTTFPGTPPSCPPRSCDNGGTGIGGTGVCSTDADCPCPVPPNGCTQVDACAERCDLRDTDEDGLADNVEQLGWVVTVRNTNGTTTERQVTSDTEVADTDGDGLDDRTELQILSDPRRADTDGDGLSDNEEFNVIYSDPTNQDTDGDAIDDMREVELFKTNALVSDSDGDGFSDPQELFEMNRDPRIADLPRFAISVGGVGLRIDERFTTTDEDGNTQTESSSTSTALQNDTSSGSSSLNQTVGNFLVQIEGGIDACQTDEACKAPDAGFISSARGKALLTAGGGAEFTTAHTTESARAAMNAFQSSQDRGRETSTGHSVTREIVGASLSAEVTLENPSDIAFRLSNVEIRVASTDPLDPSRLVPVATLFPDSTLQTGNPADFNIGPGQTRGPVLFSNRDVFPNLVEDLMRAPRGIAFSVANFDQTTEDDRNFAFGLQQVRERTARVSFDFGDGVLNEFHTVTAGVLNRPRTELRCAPTGDRPDQPCRDDGDCGSSVPCEGGTVIGGFTGFRGTGRPEGIALDFVLGDILQMRKSTPATILAGMNRTADTVARGDDVQVVAKDTMVATAGTVVVAPGRNGVLDTKAEGDDFASQGPRIVAGQNGIADSVAGGDDDVQVLSPGTDLLAAGTAVITPGANGRLDTLAAGDDEVLGPDGILPGNDGAVQSVAQGDDVQVVPVATTGVPEDTVVIHAGHNGILDTPLRGDDVAAVVSGYEVSKTCNASTPFAILAGRNGVVETKAETGICTIASPPHFVGESCSNDADDLDPDSGCGVSTSAPASTVATTPARACQGGTNPGTTCTTDAECTDGGTCGFAMECFGGTTPGMACVTAGDCGDDSTCITALELVDATAFPAGGVIIVGSQDVRYTAKAGNKLGISASATPTLPLVAGAAVTLVTGRCTADKQEIEPDQPADPNAVVVSPSTAQFLASVPGGDDVLVAPGIPCTDDADCRVGMVVETEGGECSGPQNVVRVEQRRNGQFRRFWALLMSDTTQIQTDFGAIRVRPGDAINLAFIQDVDRDGLIVQEEFLHRSSDFKKDSDGDLIGDFSEVRLGWDVGVVGQPIRHVFPDPSLRDSDGDGLSDKEEQDLRVMQCACNARGPKSLLGSGRLLRETMAAPETGAQPCTSDVACGGTPGSCRDAAHCSALRVCVGGTNNANACTNHENCPDGTCGVGCPPCSNDITLNRVDPRLSDTDGDGVTDFEEVFGYLTGAGIVDASGAEVVVAGSDLTSNTRACPRNYCVEDSDKPEAQRRHCLTDGDCFSRNCIHPVACDEVQVVSVGTGVRDARTVVVVRGPLMNLGMTTEPATGDQKSGSGNRNADSVLQGDDQLVVGPGQSVMNEAATECADGGNFMLCSAIKPGPNGRLDSLRAGDDLILPGGSGQKLEVSDPLSPDSDMDRISDGNERVLGTSPNLPGDAIFGGDLDADGLTDVLERSGWRVIVTNVSGMPTMKANIASNPNLPDTDLDGLPDFAERFVSCTIAPKCAGQKCSNDTDRSCTEDRDCNICPTDPTSVDTDADGISDFDELSAAQFAALERFNDFFPGYHIDGRTSAQHGTDPTRVDTDGDGLDDFFELFVGFTVLRDDGSIEQVFSDPTKEDTDADGSPDKEEFDNKTDPGDGDTDGDGRPDGFEVKVGTNPLREDIFVSVTYSVMQLTGPQDPGIAGQDNANEWAWRLALQEAGGVFPGTVLSTDQTDCPTNFANTTRGAAGCRTNAFNFSLNRSVALKLEPGGALVLNGIIVEIGFPDQDPMPIDNVEVDKCRMSFVDTPITYDSLRSGSFMARTFTLSGSNDCTAFVLAEIAINCVGNGRGLCRVDNPCVDSADCQSGRCELEGGGIGVCESRCGNGVREFAPETLSPGDAATCTVRNSNGEAGLRNCEVCDDGNTSDCGTCNAECGTPGAMGPKTCPEGTGCNDPLECEGTCDLVQRICVRCTVDTDCPSDCNEGTGKCNGVCGNGVVESGETCDDGNDDDCGLCNKDCTAEHSRRDCPFDTTCTEHRVCLSARCGVFGKCEKGGIGVPCESDTDCESENCADSGSCLP
jgi:hypothetical protein